jgi:hypothetical protein
LKAVIALEDVHLAQAKNYLTAYNFEIGLLINFGAASLDYKRVFRTEKKALHKTFNYIKPDSLPELQGHSINPEIYPDDPDADS